MDRPPRVSVVVPARNEAEQLPATLESIAAIRTQVPYEVIVVDGDSSDETATVAREAGARVVAGEGAGRGPGRNRGAAAASGEWLAFVDADTCVRPDYIDGMVDFVTEHDLAAASARCRVVGAWRGKAMQVVVNRVFPYLGRPVLPGFNLFVAWDAFEAVGGFPTAGNEDTAFSRRLGRDYRTAYNPAVLVETSGRRFGRQGLTGSLLHYLALDVRRLRAEY